MSPFSSRFEMSASASLPRRLFWTADARLRVQLTVEALGEVELLLVGERLVVEHEHAVLVHARADLVERLAVVDRRRSMGPTSAAKNGWSFRKPRLIVSRG